MEEETRQYLVIIKKREALLKSQNEILVMGEERLLRILSIRSNTEQMIRNHANKVSGKRKGQTVISENGDIYVNNS